MNPIDNPTAYDYLTLAGQRSPCPVVIEGAGSPRKWDEQAGYGTDGASLKWTGDGLAKFKVHFRLGTSDHFNGWAAFKPLVKKTPPGVQPKAMVIESPLLDDCEIRNVVVLDCSQLQRTEEGYEYVVEFQAYRKPKPALAAPKGAIDKPPPGPDDALDANQKMIAQLNDSNAAKSKELAELMK